MKLSVYRAQGAAHYRFVFKARKWRKHSCLPRRDSSRRLAGIDMSVNAAGRSACATVSHSRTIR